MSGSWIRADKRLAIYLRDDCRCLYCGTQVVVGAPADVLDRATLDHVVAQNLGGGNEAANLVTACGTCNSKKQDLSKRQWSKKAKADGITTDTGKMWAGVRRQTRKNLKGYRKAAKTIIAKRQEEA